MRWPCAVEAQLDAVVDQPFAQQPLADAGLRQQIDRALLEHARPHALFDVLTSRDSRTTDSMPARASR